MNLAGSIRSVGKKTSFFLNLRQPMRKVPHDTSDVPETTKVFSIPTERLDWQTTELISLLRAGRDFVHILDGEKLQSTIVHFLADKYQVNPLAFFLTGEQPSRFQLTKVRGAKIQAFQFDCTKPQLLEKIKKGLPFYVAGVKAKSRGFEQFVTGHKGLAQLQSQIWIPLVVKKDVIGLLMLGRRAAGTAFTVYDLAFLKQTADFASACINTCNIYERRTREKEVLEKKLGKLSMLYNIGRAMTFIEELKGLLGYILRQALRITGAEKGSIMLYNNEASVLQVRVVEGLKDAEVQERINNMEIPTRSFKPGEGVAGEVFSKGEPIRLNNIKQDVRFLDPEKSYVKSIVCIPLIAFGDIIGVINVTNKENEKPFSKSDEEMLQAVADQAAAAVNKAQLMEAATTDSLTGLHVRRFFMAKLSDERRRAERYSKPFSIVMVDIDHFKSVNDNYGHSIGDSVLKGVSGLLRKSVRDIDLAARYGGEEFVLLLPETNKEKAQQSAERLRNGVDLMKVGNLPHVTISLGVATYPDDGDEGKRLINKADVALYHAKETGRNKVVAYSDELGSLRKRIAKGLKKGIFK